MAKRVTVIFTKEVAGAAKEGEKRTVAAGYWRNFLVPRGLARSVNQQEMKAALAAVVAVEMVPEPIEKSVIHPEPSVRKPKVSRKEMRPVQPVAEVKRESRRTKRPISSSTAKRARLRRKEKA